MTAGASSSASPLPGGKGAAEPKAADDGRAEHKAELEAKAQLKAKESALQAEAKQAELVAVQAIEEAIGAAHISEANRPLIERARKELEEAEEEVARTQALAEQMTAESEAATKEAETFKGVVPKARAILEAAEAAAANAVETAARAAEAVREAELEVKRAESGIGQLVEKSRTEAHHLKVAKREAERAAAKAAEAVTVEAAAAAAISVAEAHLTKVAEAAREAAKRAFTAREEEEALAAIVETATDAWKAVEGEGGVWEKRTLDNLRDRETEYKRAASIADKANKAEQDADAAETEAQTRVDEAHRDHEEKTEQLTKHQATSAEYAEALIKQQEISDAADKETSEAKAVADKAQAKLKQAQDVVGETTVERADVAVSDARIAEEKAVFREAKLATASEEAAEKMRRAIAAHGEAVKARQAKVEHSAEVALKQRDADGKVEAADAACVDLEAKVFALGMAMIEARGALHAGSEQEGRESAEANQSARRQAAARDIKAVALGTAKSADGRPISEALTAVDKWQLFKLGQAEEGYGPDVWNMRKLFYQVDGSFHSVLPLMVSDVVGSALDRSPASAAHCKLSGDGLTKAALGQTASFTISAFSDKGIAFDTGGDTFAVAIRFVGLAITVRAKIVDNEDGSYTVSFKPTSTGTCSIAVSLVSSKDNSTPLPGSPYACVVSGPVPCAEMCAVRGDALARIVAQNPASFFISFRDALGQVSHASELDVWAEPALTHGRTSPLMMAAAFTDPAPPLATPPKPDRGEHSSRVETPIGGSPPGPAPPAGGGATGGGGAGSGATAAEGSAPPPAVDVSSGDAVATSSASPMAAPGVQSPDGSARGVGSSSSGTVVATRSGGVAGDGDGASLISADVLSHLLAPTGAFESFVVGARPLDVTRSAERVSSTIGRLQPGRPLKLLRIEPPDAEGALRACVVLELEDVEPREWAEWRRVYPQEPEWRTLSWRARLVEAQREEEDAAKAAQREIQRQMDAAATKVQGGWRSKNARNRTGKMRRDREAAVVAAAEEAEAARRAAEAEEEARSKAAETKLKKDKTDGRGGKDSKKGGSGSPAKGPGKGKGGGSGKPKAAKAVEEKTKRPAAVALSPRSKNRLFSSGVLRVHLKQANGLMSADANGLSDPYVVVQVGQPKQEKKSKIIRETLEPKWNEKYTFKGKLADFLATGLALRMYDSDEVDRSTMDRMAKDEVIGDVTVNLDALKNAETIDVDAPLSTQGTVSLAVTWLNKQEQDAATYIQSRVRAMFARRRWVHLLYQLIPAYCERHGILPPELLAAASAPAAAPAGPNPLPSRVPLRPGGGGPAVAANAPAGAGRPKIRGGKDSGGAPKDAAAKLAGVAATPRVAGKPRTPPGKVRTAKSPEAKGAKSSRPPSRLGGGSSSPLGKGSSLAGMYSGDEMATPMSAELSQQVSRGKRAARTSRASTQLVALGGLAKPTPTELYGWVTLALGDDVFVTRQTGRLPAHLRQRHLQQWDRRQKIDSERERERAALLGQEVEEARAREAAMTGALTASPKGMRSPRSATVIPHDHRAESNTVRPAYLNVRASDPKHIGFAYGGVYPGRLHAKGQLVEQHEVSFSIGVAGTYLLHVNLRESAARGSAVVPGSPFLLRVSPGSAYPLSTQLPPEALPLRGGSTQPTGGGGKAASRAAGDNFSCELVLVGRDKMGNACDAGGANITCGYIEPRQRVSAGDGEPSPSSTDPAVGASGTPARKPPESSVPLSPQPPSPSPPPPPPPKRGANCIDNRDGTYSLRWFSEVPGTFNVFVKIDGLHVLGSPAKMLLSPPSPVPSPPPSGATLGATMNTAEFAVKSKRSARDKKAGDASPTSKGGTAASSTRLGKAPAASPAGAPGAAAGTGADPTLTKSLARAEPQAAKA